MNLILSSARRWGGLIFAVLCFADVFIALSEEARELVRDPEFMRGFFLLEPKPGTRVAYTQIPGLSPGGAVWDLAQWSSRFPLGLTNLQVASSVLSASNAAKTVSVTRTQGAGSVLSLAVNAGCEYPTPRTSTAQPWVHLLVQQELQHPPALGDLTSLTFHAEARLSRSRLVTTNGYSQAIHAAQFLIYLTIANRNPEAAGYRECFWFGIPLYDDRSPIVPAYQAQDFGDTKLFIYTPGSDTFSSRSTHEGRWTTFEKDLVPLIRQALDDARKKGFIKGSTQLSDWAPLGIFIGWEVPGSFDVELQLRRLSLRAAVKNR